MRRCLEPCCSVQILLQLDVAEKWCVCVPEVAAVPATSEHIRAARPQVAQAQPRLQLQGGLPRRGQHLHAGPCAGLAATHLAHQPVRALPATACRTGDSPSPNLARPCALACSAVLPTLGDTGSRRCNGLQAASQHLHAADARPLPAGAHAQISLTIDLKALHSVHTLSNQSMHSMFHLGGARHGAASAKISAACAAACSGAACIGAN